MSKNGTAKFSTDKSDYLDARLDVVPNHTAGSVLNVASVAAQNLRRVHIVHKALWHLLVLGGETVQAKELHTSAHPPYVHFLRTVEDYELTIRCFFTVSQP